MLSNEEGLDSTPAMGEIQKKVRNSFLLVWQDLLAVGSDPESDRTSPKRQRVHSPGV